MTLLRVLTLIIALVALFMVIQGILLNRDLEERVGNLEQRAGITDR